MKTFKIKLKNGDSFYTKLSEKEVLAMIKNLNESFEEDYQVIDAIAGEGVKKMVIVKLEQLAVIEEVKRWEMKK